MNDEATIRRANLRQLGKTASELAALVGGGYSFWAALLPEGSKKAFGEKLARKVEEKLNLVRGCMDTDEGPVEAWPFKQVSQERYLKLSPEAQVVAQVRMMDEIERQERLAKSGIAADAPLRRTEDATRLAERIAAANKGNFQPTSPPPFERHEKHGT